MTTPTSPDFHPITTHSILFRQSYATNYQTDIQTSDNKDSVHWDIGLLRVFTRRCATCTRTRAPATSFFAVHSRTPTPITIDSLPPTAQPFPPTTEGKLTWISAIELSLGHPEEKTVHATVTVSSGFLKSAEPRISRPRSRHWQRQHQPVPVPHPERQRACRW